MMIIIKRTRLNYQLRLNMPRLKLLTRTMILKPFTSWEIVNIIHIGALERFVLSKNSSIKLNRIAKQSCQTGAKKVLKDVLTMSARKEIINGISNTASLPTNKNIHQLSNSWTQMTSPLVKLMPVPVQKTFVATIFTPRWPTAMLMKHQRKKSTLWKALVTGSYRKVPEKIIASKWTVIRLEMTELPSISKI